MSTQRAIAELEGHLDSGYVLFGLVSPEEARWERALAALAGRRSLPLRTWSATRGLDGAVDPGSSEPRALLERLGAEEAPSLYLLKDFHPFLGDPWVVRVLRELERGLGERGSAILLLSATLAVPPELERDLLVLDLPLPDPSDLQAVAGGALQAWGGSYGDDDLERIGLALTGLTEQAARRAVRRALQGVEAVDAGVVAAVLAEKKRALAESELLEFLEPRASLGEVGGLGELKAWVGRRRHAFDARARERGLPSPKGVLLLGVQGCGKSLASRAIAAEWGFPLVRLDLPAVVRSERQVRASGLRRALEIVELLAPVVLWVDELEKGFAGGSGEAEGAVARALGTFVTWLQEKTAAVFVVATANRVDVLPPELLRKGRFDETFFVDLPSLKERGDILRIHLERTGLEPGAFDVEALARASGGFSGSELEQAVLSATYEAFAAEREVATGDVRASLRSSVPLSVTMEEAIDGLREWASDRARPASLDTRLKDMIEETLAEQGGAGRH